jgi:protein O-mannosyl-transferase
VKKIKFGLSKNWQVALFFIIVGFGLYANTLGNEMFWDDDDFVLNNQFLRSWHYFPKYFSENLIAGAGLLSNYWRPILLAVFSSEWHLWQDWSPGYHFINASFHIIDAILLFFILLKIFKSRWLAVFTALFFLVHPLQTEAVSYVSGLGDSLSVFFIFWGILFYLNFRAYEQIRAKNISYLKALLMFVLALMSKETAIIMPVLILIVDFFSFREKKLSVKKRLKRAGAVVWPFFVLAGIYVMARATILNFGRTFNLYDEENIFTANFHVRLLTFFRILVIYFGLLFWPFGLHMERSAEIATSFLSLSVLLGAALFLALLALAIIKFERWPVFSFGIGWFFVSLAPVSNLAVPINGLLYEHWLYLPLIGIFLILAWFGVTLAKKYYRGRKVAILALVSFLIFLSVLTVRRNRDWRDPITFYTKTLEYSPDSYRVVNNLGMAYAQAGDYERAEGAYRQAIALVLTEPAAYHNLANLYWLKGQKDLAVENFEKAISADSGFIFSYRALASFYLESKEPEKAREVLEKYPDYGALKAEVLFLLAEITAGEGDLGKALSYLEEALVLEPNNRIVEGAIRKIKSLD